MSVQLISEVMRYSRAKDTTRTVLLALAYHHHHRDLPERDVEMLAEDLAAAANTSRNSLYRSLKKLYETGEVELLGGKGGRGRGDRWRIADLDALYADGTEPTRNAFRSPRAAETVPPSEPKRPEKRPEKRPAAGTVSSRVNAVGRKKVKKEHPLSSNGNAARGGEEDIKFDPRKLVTLRRVPS